MLPDLQYDQLPAAVQVLLNVVGFIIASAMLWYGYFVRGKEKITTDANSKPEQEMMITPYDAKAFRQMCEDVASMKTSSEAMEHQLNNIYVVLKHDSDEAEIRRRVEEELRLRSKLGNNND